MKIRRSDLQEIARQCVYSMGDIFWDAHQFPENGIVTSPERVAVNAVMHTMDALAQRLGASVVDDCLDLVTQERVD